MAMTRENLLERVCMAYGPYYDIVRCDEAEAPLMVRAAFHEHATSYMISKKAQMWAADRHEYAWFFSVPRLTMEVYEKCLAQVMEEGNPLVKPGKDHMCTALVALFFCDEADEDALKTLKKCHIRKSFQFSLKGWMEVQTAAAVLGKDGSVTANSAGYNLAKFLKNTLHPKVKRRFF